MVSFIIFSLVLNYQKSPDLAKKILPCFWIGSALLTTKVFEAFLSMIFYSLKNLGLRILEPLHWCLSDTLWAWLLVYYRRSDSASLLDSILALF